MDANLGRLKVTLKSRKWYISIVYHLIDVTIVNYMAGTLLLFCCK